MGQKKEFREFPQVYTKYSEPYYGDPHSHSEAPNRSLHGYCKLPSPDQTEL